MLIPAEAKPPLLTEGVLPLLRDLILERIGIYFEEAKLEFMFEKIKPLAKELNFYSYLDYYYHLKYDEKSGPQWDSLMEALSVQETYFWREFSQIKALTHYLVPAWFKKSERTLKIWSAACASGEEPYGIAMALMETGWGQHPIEIYGSDFSLSAIQKAKQAMFRENAFRGFSPLIREKYFSKNGNCWKLNDDLIRKVQFQRANLMAPDETDRLARAPVIFCRNVFIYFSAHSIRQTAANFASRMPRNGHLFVGASESLLRLSTDFELRELGDAFVYVRI